jgi:predicted transcriptional regulator
MIDIDQIRRAIRRGDITKSALARKASLRASTVQRIEQDNWDPHASTVRKLVKAYEALATTVKKKTSKIAA